jgi:trigger factor
MKITREQRESNCSLLKVVVGEADYGEAVEKLLRDYKRKANVPGFRPGMVPMGIIRKMYGKGAVAEQAYKLASNSVFEYLQKEGIDYVGDVIPSEEQGDFDFENNTEHEFMFEIGEAPKVELALSAKDKLTYHKIKVDKKMRDAYKDNYLRRYGRLVDVEKVKKDEALTVILDNGDMRIEDAYVGLISMSDEERKPFINKKVGSKMNVNINELYKNPAQRASILGVKEEELEGINPEFKLEIKQVRQFANPELNEEFFKMAFPAGDVKSEEELDALMAAEIEKELARETDYLFTIHVRNFIMEKAALQMPEAFLKRWLYTINEGKFSMEEIEKDFDGFVKMFTWNYLQKHFIQTANLSVSPEEVEAEAKEFAKAQFAQYGMPSAPEEMVANFAKQILENKEQAQKIYEKLYEVKVVEHVKSLIKVTNKAVTSEEFAELAKANN